MVTYRYEDTWWDNDNYHWWIRVESNWVPEWLVDWSY